MTYYDLIQTIQDIVDNPQNQELIAKIENYGSIQNNERYEHFLVHMNYLIKERINKAKDSLFNKIFDKALSVNELSLELSILNNESDYLKKICNISLIKTEDKQKLLDLITEYKNDILKHLLDMFIDEEKINIIKQYIVEVKDEL